MEQGEYISIPQLAKILGISRIAVYKKVKREEIKAVRIRRNFAISKESLKDVLGDFAGSPLKECQKRKIEKVVKRTFKEYDDTLRLLGSE